MNLSEIFNQYGFPVACVIGLAIAGKWLLNAHLVSLNAHIAALVARIAALEKADKEKDDKIEKLNVYIRDDLARMAEEAHDRERELISICKSQMLPHQMPDGLPMSGVGTTRIMAAVHGKTKRRSRA